MTNEQLLQPRYQVRIDFPQLVFKFEKNDVLIKRGIHFTNEVASIREDLLDLYPSVFRRMMWWERRREEDMPKYLRCTNRPDTSHYPGMIFKIDEWFARNCGRHDKIGVCVCDTDCYVPATEEEYLEYIKNN